LIFLELDTKNFTKFKLEIANSVCEEVDNQVKETITTEKVDTKLQSIQEPFLRTDDYHTGTQAPVKKVRDVI